MNSIADGSVIVQTFSQSVPSTPPWFGEVALLVQYLRKHDILPAICKRVRFARRRFGRYEVIDFVAVLFGYAISGECTLEAFYQHLHPFAPAFMALFGRERFPARSTLSRFLASLSQTEVEAFRALFLDDLLARPLNKERQIGGLVDRAGRDWVIFDIDGAREAARQRALPKTPNLPAPHRRLEPLCAPGYTGRKRGEIVRTRTTIVQAHTSQWLGSLANPGNGLYREELRQAVAIIRLYCKAHGLPEERVLLRLDGLYGTGAVLADLGNFSCVTRGKDYSVLDQHEEWLDGFGMLKTLYSLVENPEGDKNERNGIDKGCENADAMIAKGFAGIGRAFCLCRGEPGQTECKDIGERMTCIREQRQRMASRPPVTSAATIMRERKKASRSVCFAIP